MPRKDTPRYKMAYGWLRGEDWWGDPTSNNRVALDALLHPLALSMTLTEPPADNADGDCYIVAQGAIGAWEGKADHLAMYVEGEWWFFAPVEGVRVRVRGLAFFWWDGEAWIPEEVSGIPDPEEGTRYDISISVGYPPEPGETLLVLPIPQAMMLGKDAPGSRATILSPPSQGVQLAIMRNGGQVGSVVFSSSSFSGTLLVPNNVTFAVGDRLHVMCPPNLPDRFQEFGIVLRMTLLP